MAFLYIYQASDFVSLPGEDISEAGTTLPVTLTLKSTAVPIKVQINDDDEIFNEIDATQSLGETVQLNGTSYAAGTTINTAYDLTNSSTGHQVTSFHFGGDGYQDGPVDGLVSSEPLLAGQSYTFDTNVSSFEQPNPYSKYVACFVNGTLIETEHGPRPVEDLVAGDLVVSDCGRSMPLRLALSRRIGYRDLRSHPEFAPVRIKAGALGQGLPRRDLLVSPQHRMLVNSPIVRRMFGVDDVLVAATKLVGLPGVAVDTQVQNFSYHHLVFDGHEVVLAEGAPSESFYCGEFALKSMTPEARAEMETLFPEVFTPEFQPSGARPIPPGRLQKKLVQRQAKNAKPLLSSAA